MASMKSGVVVIFLMLGTFTYCTCTFYSGEQYFGDGLLHNGGKIWAVLVAGSNGYFNYRHQADVCHAYQILRKNGIPEENIIVMMYDDIARNSQNPTPNIILNHPDGPDVYQGVKIDYTGKEVNASNFLAVLTGNAKAVESLGTGRVIESGQKDHIFVNFVDHGAPGFLCFPHDQLHAKELEKALKLMHDQNKFDKMVLYVEACESGSMFEAILPDDMNIFVMTAADPRESSYACYFDSLRGTYLGDVFSVKWMEDSDTENLSNETIHHQFSVVRRETNTSHVEEYGDLGIGSMFVASFQGSSDTGLGISKLPPITDAVPSHHVPISVLKNMLAVAADEDRKDQLEFQIHKLIKLRHHLEKIIARIAAFVAHQNEKKIEVLLETRKKLTSFNLDCYEKAVKYFNQNCFNISENPHTLTQMYVLINMCSEPWVSQASIYEAMNESCDNTQKVTGIL